MIALITAILALEAKLLPYQVIGGGDLWDLLKKLRSHKDPVAAIKAATVTVDALDDRETNDPNSPYFSE